jgi:hypothetical protein
MMTLVVILAGMMAVFAAALLFPVQAILVGATLALLCLSVYSEAQRVLRGR